MEIYFVGSVFENVYKILGASKTLAEAKEILLDCAKAWVYDNGGKNNYVDTLITGVPPKAKLGYYIAYANKDIPEVVNAYQVTVEGGWMSNSTSVLRGFFHIIKANENDVPLVFGTDYEKVTKNYRSVIDDQRATIDHLEDQSLASKSDILDIKEQYLEKSELVELLINEEKELLAIVRGLEKEVEEKNAQLKVFEEEERELIERVNTLDDRVNFLEEENRCLGENAEAYVTEIEELKSELERLRTPPMFKFSSPSFEQLTKPKPEPSGIPRQDSYGNVMAELMSYSSPKDVLRANTKPSSIPLPPPPPPLPPTLINFHPIITPPRRFNDESRPLMSYSDEEEKETAMSELEKMLQELDSKIEDNRFL